MGLPFVDLWNLFIDDPYFFYLPDEKIAPASPLPGFLFLNHLTYDFITINAVKLNTNRCLSNFINEEFIYFCGI
jgi:hypothetical protein